MTDREAVRYAAGLIRQGRLVAFPTETVYGLGANALDERAVRRIFEAKGRPPESPMIVHVASVEMARGLAIEWPRQAAALAGRWWPGPLTLVLRKHFSIPGIVTAGLDTVALRMPSHPLALELIREAGVPLAAPSANRFTELSPTTAEHVRRGLGERVDFILDGGPTTVGIESTVLSLTTVPPQLLRPGMVSRPDIEAWIGPVELGGRPGAAAHPSPGMHDRHYSPRTPVVLGSLPGSGRGAWLYWRQPFEAARMVKLPEEAAACGADLYRTLHELDREGWDWIAVETPPDGPQWAAIADRLGRAAGVIGRPDPPGYNEPDSS